MKMKTKNGLTYIVTIFVIIFGILISLLSSCSPSSDVYDKQIRIEFRQVINTEDLGDSYEKQLLQLLERADNAKK